MTNILISKLKTLSEVKVVHFLLHLTFLFWFLYPHGVDIVSGTPEEPTLTFEHLYQYGKNEYTVENWRDCVAFMLRALDDFQYFRDEILSCRKNCNQRLKFDLANASFSDSELSARAKDSLLFADRDLWVTTKIRFTEVQRSLCHLKCYEEKFTDQRPSVQKAQIYEDFLRRKPHHYLQFSYWKLGDLKNAVKSAYTYLIANPGDKDTIDNLNFYMDQKGFDRETMLVDTDRPAFERLYLSAVEAYQDGDWNKCTELFQQSLDSFFEALENCRLMCDHEAHFDWTAMADTAVPEFGVMFSSLFASVLRCRSHCLRQLSRLNGREVPNILASFFHYLHVCQYNTGHGLDVAQSVANALLLNPKSVLMRRNKRFYLDAYKNPELFEPNQKVVDFHRRTELERRFLAFVDEKFRYESPESRSLDRWHPTDQLPLDMEVPIEDTFDYNRLDASVLTESECHWLRPHALVYPGIFINHAKLFMEELGKRIAGQYDSVPPEFTGFSCGFWRPTGCERTPFVVSLEEDRCAETFGEHFGNGCAAIFCAD